MTFTTELFLDGKTATGLRVPETYVELLELDTRPPSTLCERHAL